MTYSKKTKEEFLTLLFCLTEIGYQSVVVNAAWNYFIRAPFELPQISLLVSTILVIAIRTVLLKDPFNPKLEVIEGKPFFESYHNELQKSINNMGLVGLILFIQLIYQKIIAL
jgi:hypothetical protein